MYQMVTGYLCDNPTVLSRWPQPLQEMHWSKWLLLLLLLLSLCFYPLYAGYLQFYTWKNHVSSIYSFAVFLYLQFVLHVMFIRTWSMLRIFTLVLPELCVQWPVCFFFFCNSYISWFSSMLLGYCLNDADVVPLPPAITVITFALNSIVSSLYFRINTITIFPFYNENYSVRLQYFCNSIDWIDSGLLNNSAFLCEIFVCF